MPNLTPYPHTSPYAQTGAKFHIGTDATFIASTNDEAYARRLVAKYLRGGVVMLSIMVSRYSATVGYIEDTAHLDDFLANKRYLIDA